MVLAALLAAAVALAIFLVGTFASSRRTTTPRGENYGTVSERWLAVHRTERR